MKYDTFLVDADDTIFDFQKAFRVSMKKSFAECGLPFEDRYYEVYHRINEGLWRRLERKEITREDLIRLRYSSILKELNIDYDDLKLNGVYIKNLGECAIFLEGADVFLEKLHSLGRIYIITNGFASVQRGRMKHFEMQRFAENAFISEEVGAEKPDVKYMQYVFDHIPNFDPEKTLVIGDGITSDIKAAETTGLDSVWFDPNGKNIDGQTKICMRAESFDEILRLIETSQKGKKEIYRTYDEYKKEKGGKHGDEV